MSAADTARDLHVLRHSLGINQAGRSYRNHFCAGPGHHDYDTCSALVDRGFMQRHAARTISGGDEIFTVTAAGRQFVADNAPPPPKLTRGQRRYRAWLEADCGLEFGDWLKRGAA